MKKSLADKLLEYADKNPDGFTVKVADGKLTPVTNTEYGRYAVSTTHITSASQVRENFYNWYNGFAGGWYDKKDDEYCIDKTLIVDDKKRAFQIGRTYGQKYIFDLKKMIEIKIPKLF